MIVPPRLLFLSCLALALTRSALAVPLGEPPVPAEIARLIDQLGNDDFATREAASKRLESLGDSALPALRKATRSEDREVSQRAKRIITEIGKRLFREIGRLNGHTGQVNCLSLSSDGTRLLTGSQDTTVRLWDVKTGKELLQLKDQPGGVWCVALSADGKRGLSSAGMIHKGGMWVHGSDFSIVLWDLEAGKVVRKLEGHTKEVRSVVFSADGRRALSAGWEGVPRLWDLETGKEVRKYEGHTSSIRKAVLSPDGSRILSASRDKTVRLWDTDTGKELRRFEGHGEDVLTVAFTPDGRSALSGGADKTLRLWNLQTGKELRRFEGHTSVIWNVAVSPDGRRALSVGGCKSRGEGYYEPSGMDYDVRLWDVATGEELFALEGHTNSVMSAVFLPKGRRALSAGLDTTIRQWSLAADKD